MSVTSETMMWSYAGTGLLSVFPYKNKIFENTDLEVYIRDAAGVETLQTLNVDYTVSGAGVDTGGNVTFMAAPGATETVVIRINLPLTQATVLPETGMFPAKGVEYGLDRTVKLCQQLAEELGRAPRAAAASGYSDLALPLPGSLAVPYYLRWNSGATALEAVASELTDTVDSGVVYALEYGPAGYGSLVDAINAIGSTITALVLTPGTWGVTADLAVPANIHLTPLRGAKLQIATTKTLTINGTLSAGPYQIFECVGTGKVVFGTNVPELWADWWGVTGTGDQAAINAAIVAATGGKTVRGVFGKTYVADATVEFPSTSTYIIMEDFYINAPTLNDEIILISDFAGVNRVLDIRLKNVRVNGAGYDAAAYAAYPNQTGICIGNSSRVSLEDVVVTNIARVGICGRKPVAGTKYWNLSEFKNVKVNSCGDTGISIGRLNYADAANAASVDDLTMVNVYVGHCGNAKVTAVVSDPAGFYGLGPIRWYGGEVSGCYNAVDPTNGAPTAVYLDHWTGIVSGVHFEINGGNAVNSCDIRTGSSGYGGVILSTSHWGNSLLAAKTGIYLTGPSVTVINPMFSHGATKAFDYGVLSSTTAVNAYVAGAINATPGTAFGTAMVSLSAAAAGSINDTNGLRRIIPRVAVPTVSEGLGAGVITVADRATWDPLAVGSGNAYPVYYDGSAWKSMMADYLSGSTTWDPANLNDGAGETKSLTVTGAALGDAVMVFPPYDLQDFIYSGYVQAANTVEIRIQNESGGAVDLASGTWKVRVFKP